MELAINGHDWMTRLHGDVQTTKTATKLMSGNFDESTEASWIWAFLFGPVYFLVHGFFGRAALLVFLNLILIGFVVAPFMVYPAWRKRAEERASEHMMMGAVHRF
jgi:uncharacterized membrane protein YoaK (UPF0700 family)